VVFAGSLSVVRNRHHTKKGPGRVHWQGFEHNERQLFRSWEQGQLEDQIKTLQTYVNQHAKGILGRIARWRLVGLQEKLAEMKK
jgi:hypothetical protein